jgi:hypothetical protein
VPKRAQQQRNESRLEFELRRIGYLGQGLADLPGQPPEDYQGLLALLREAGFISASEPAPLAVLFRVVRSGVDDVMRLNRAASAVLTTLLAIDPSAQALSPDARYDVASTSFGSKQFERSARLGSRRHAFGLLASAVEQRARTAPAAPQRSGTFITIDDPSLPSARDIFGAASELRVRTRSGAALLNGYKTFIQEMLANGGELLLLTLQPGSAAADRAYGSEPVLFDANRAVAQACVDRIREEVPDGSIRWRETAEPASMSQIIAVRREAPSISLVQFNLVYAAAGRERPAVMLEEDDPWFAAFADEFDHIWRFRSEERPLRAP